MSAQDKQLKMQNAMSKIVNELAAATASEVDAIATASLNELKAIHAGQQVLSENSGDSNVKLDEVVSSIDEVVSSIDSLKVSIAEVTTSVKEVNANIKHQNRMTAIQLLSNKEYQQKFNELYGKILGSCGYGNTHGSYNTPVNLFCNDLIKILNLFNRDCGMYLSNLGNPTFYSGDKNGYNNYNPPATEAQCDQFHVFLIESIHELTGAKPRVEKKDGKYAIYAY